MQQLTEQQILALAPNASAAANGKKISDKGGFVRLEHSADDTYYWGECTGSGKSNYTTSIDFIDPDAPMIRCSCPSRQFPCKPGLALMYEPYFRMSTLRMPMVMALATREMTSPETVWSGQQDAISVRDAGWIQVFCDNNQEIMDMVIQGYKLAEHPDVLIPVNVCYDGFYSSHLTEGVDVPDQKEVDEFLPAPSFAHCVLDPEKPFALDPLTPGPLLMKYRKSHLDAMEKALDVIEEIDKEFGDKFGRYYGGAISEYRTEDAEVILITIAGMTGTGMDAVDIAREKGIKAGLIKLRFVRPFPAKRIAQALQGKKAFAVVDRSVCFGWSQGPMHMEVKAAIVDVDEKYAHFSAIGGLGGADISLQNMLDTITQLDAQKNESGEKTTKWFMNE